MAAKAKAPAASASEVPTGDPFFWTAAQVQAWLTHCDGGKWASYAAKLDGFAGRRMAALDKAAWTQRMGSAGVADYLFDEFKRLRNDAAKAARKAAGKEADGAVLEDGGVGATLINNARPGPPKF
uniref:SAM domain-containing protein n=1 Tax=Bicosoecida sp. CB-2014 TaxID=1486930 RepID=A0A7S1GG08_9STRA